MDEDLCRGWRAREVIKAWKQSSPLMQEILTSIAKSGGSCTISDIEKDIGKTRLQIQRSLGMWSQTSLNRWE